MPSGENENSKANLLKGNRFKQGEKKPQEEIERREQTKREKRQIRSYIEMLLEKEVSKDGNGRSICGAEAIAIKAMQGALNGDWKAWELVRDTAGQKPAEKVEFADISTDVIEEIEAMVYDTE